MLVAVKAIDQTSEVDGLISDHQDKGILDFRITTTK